MAGERYVFGGLDKLPREFAYNHEVADVVALKALQAGTADEAQQRRALDWILRTACMTYDETFHESERASIFMQGRRFVGLKLVALLTRDIATLREQEAKNIKAIKGE